MNRVLNEFATKEANGSYSVSRENALKLASEVIRNNEAVAQDQDMWNQIHIDNEFPKAWNHFDNLNQGKIAAVEVPQFLRFFSRKNTIQLG